MTDLVFCRKCYGPEYYPWEPDPEAPNVAEIVEVLQKARGWCPPGESQIRYRINDLIARLEPTNE